MKAVFLDVDGTILSFQTHRITQAVKDALNTLHQRGIKLCLATGRHKAMLHTILPQLPIDGVITMSGQYCYVGDQILLRNPMAQESVEELVQATQRGGFSTIFLGGEEVYVNHVDPPTEQFVRDLNIEMPPLRPLEYALTQEVYQAVVFLTPDQEYQLLEMAPHLKTTRWHDSFLDVLPPTGGKDRGMEAMEAYFGLTPQDCMAFGDGENDLSMLIHAGVGVAMGTASQRVKAGADYVTSSVDEDGVVAALKHFHLL